MARIPQPKIDEILSATNIASYIARYVSLKQTGKNFKGLCPFHKEKTPSFIVSPEKQIFHCFGCGKGGNVFSFLMGIENISYFEAIRKVAFDLGIKLPEYTDDKYESGESEYDKLYNANESARDFFVSELSKKGMSPARDYLKNRKLKLKTIKKFEIGFAPNKWDALINSNLIKGFDQQVLNELGLIQKKDKSKGYYDKFRNRIMFPFHNLSNHIIGFGGRGLSEKDIPKYLNSPESNIYKKGKILYGLYQAIPFIREKKAVFIVEGYFDLLRLVDSGIENVVASSGTALTEGQGKLLKRYTNTVIISYDSDSAGIQAAIRNSQILEAVDLNVYLLQLPPPHDPDSYILKEGIGAFFELIKNKISPIEFELSGFLRKHPNASMDEKDHFINTTLEKLIKIPNDVKIGLYVHQIAGKLEIAESLLISRINRLKKQARFQNVNYVKEDKKEQTTQRLSKGQWRAEEGIISLLLLNNQEISKQILNQISSSDFENEEYQKIFEQISFKWEEMGTIDVNKIQEDISDNESQSLIAKLSLQNIDDVKKYATDCIYQLRKWTLNIRFNEIKRAMHEESDSQESILHYMQELATIRKKLTEIEQERTSYLKSDI